MRILLTSFLALLTMAATAQKKELVQDKQEILDRAAAAFDAAMQPGGALYTAVSEEKLIGNYLLQVSFREKGDVSSVFVVTAEDHDIRSQNRIKDLVHQLELPFKMPKDKQYRIDHRFDLNSCKYKEFKAKKGAVTDLTEDGGDFVYVYEKKTVTKVGTR